MNFIARWWKNRHRHDYKKTRIPCESWRAPAFLIQSKCDCGMVYYHISTVMGTQHVDQTWASHIFNPQK